MAATVTCGVTMKIVLKREDDSGTGFDSSLSLEKPYKFASTAITCTKAAAREWTLAASTPETVDFTALASAWSGDLAFSTGRVLYVENREAVGSGRVVKVGAEGSAAELYDPISDAAGATFTVLPGTSRIFHTREAGGWPLATRHKLKLDPGSNPCAVSVGFGGD